MTLTDTKVLWALLKQWVDNLLWLNLLDGQWSWGNLLADNLLLQTRLQNRIEKNKTNTD